jgi:hypothetical protein
MTGDPLGLTQIPRPGALLAARLSEQVMVSYRGSLDLARAFHDVNSFRGNQASLAAAFHDVSGICRHNSEVLARAMQRMR